MPASYRVVAFSLLLLSSSLHAQQKATYAVGPASVTISGSSLAFQNSGNTVSLVQTDTEEASPQLLPEPSSHKPSNLQSALRLTWGPWHDTLWPGQSKDLHLETPPLNAEPKSPRLLLVEAADQSCADEFPFCYRSVFINVGDPANSASAAQWIRGFVATGKGLYIDQSVLANPRLTIVVNGLPVQEKDLGTLAGSPYATNYTIQVFTNIGCRKYLIGDDERENSESITINMPPRNLKPQSANGIQVGEPKVYDSYALRNLMSTSASQLAAISPWNAAAITGAYGNIQGVTRDVSYLAAQLQTTPVPATTTAQNNLYPTTIPSTVTTTQAGQCPVGSYPTVSTAGTLTCTPPALTLSSGTAPTCPANSYPVILATGALTCVSLSTAPLASSPLGLNYSTIQTTSPSPTTTNVTTNAGGYSPVIPAAPASTAVSAPTNIGVGSADMLAEQAQISAQLQIYQLLLQGAASDQFLTRNSRVITNRAQTTLGFEISLSPPRQFKHAVAEVRIVMVPYPGQLHRSQDAVRIVNLLPSQKTYNVAKITSRQNSFGAGVVVEQVNAGFTTGRAKDRLYLAKDTDTVALEYPNLSVPVLHSPLPERIWEGMQAAVKMQRLDECSDDWMPEGALGVNRQIQNAPLMFGWQFRPVLGADYVAAGPRQVFAQLALPDSNDDQSFAPIIFVQTRWREYDEKRQVVGPVYHSSCTVEKMNDPATLLSPLKVKNVTWDDMGGGTLKLRAEGEFFASGMTILSGGTNIPPVAFDGRSIQFFAPAKDLLASGPIQLLGESRRPVPFSIATAQAAAGCGLAHATITAVPYPDGNSRVTLKLEYGSYYVPSRDRYNPLLLIGSTVYGLRENPFTQAPHSANCDAQQTTCYQFTAPTDSLRTARTFLVRDLAWDKFGSLGSITFTPAFTSLSAFSAPPAKPVNQTTVSKPCKKKKGKPCQAAPPANKPAPVWYSVAGFDLKPLEKENNFGNLTLYTDTSETPVALTKDNFRVLSATTALLKLSAPPKGKSIKIIWDPSGSTDSTPDSLPVAWDLSLPSPDKQPAVSSDPAFLYTGDSRTVTFTGSDFSKITNVTFEGLSIFTPPAPSSPHQPLTTLKVPVSSSITKTPGHKELTGVSSDGKTKITLPIDVLRR